MKKAIRYRIFVPIAVGLFIISCGEVRIVNDDKVNILWNGSPGQTLLQSIHKSIPVSYKRGKTVLII